MKNLKYALLAVSLLMGGGLIAETKAQAAKRKAAAAKLKEHEKYKKIKKTKTHHTGYTKQPEKPVTHHKAATTKTTKAVAPTRTASAATTAKPQEKSYVNQLTDALGWTGGTTAAAAATTATTAAATTHEVHHRGPADWHEKHHFPPGWTYGFTGRWVGNKWLFAGHDLPWWHKHYKDSYYRIVREEATKAGVPRQHFAHEHAK